MRPSDLKTVLSACIQARRPVLIKGAPGIGKTDIVFQSAAEAGARVILSHPVVSDPTDFKGLPGIVNGKAEFLPFGDLREAVETDEPTVFFMDDLGQAPPSVQAAAMQLLLARRVNGHMVSDQVTFIAATNRREDRAGVQGMLEPVKSRFASILELNVDLDDWVVWALPRMPIELISFIRYRPGLLHDFKASSDMINTPSPRTVANVGYLMGAGIPSHLEYEVYAGSAGEGFAAEFCGFLRIFRDLPNPDVILMNPDKAEVPKDPATLYALCGALSRKSSDTTIDRLVRYFNRLPMEFNVLAMRDSIAQDKNIANTTAAIQWFTTHRDVLI